MKRKPITSRTKSWIRHQWLHGREWIECHYCGTRLSSSQITLDHVTPKAKGGSNYISNLVPACECCNKRKKDTPYQMFIQQVAA